MPLQLKKRDVDAAIPKVKDGLMKYMWLQSQVLPGANYHLDPGFQRRFNGFYRVRRPLTWRVAYFDLMGIAHNQKLSFPIILDRLHKQTHRYEASFASKLFATLNPTAPVIDSVVLRNLNFRIPPTSVSHRLNAIDQLHKNLTREFKDFLSTADGHYLVQKFNVTYPLAKATVTDEKKLDLVLWQSRG